MSKVGQTNPGHFQIKLRYILPRFVPIWANLTYSGPTSDTTGIDQVFVTHRGLTSAAREAVATRQDVVPGAVHVAAHLYVLLLGETEHRLQRSTVKHPGQK